MRVDRKLIFDAAKRRGAVFRTIADVRDMDAAIDAALASGLPAANTGHVEASPPIPQAAIDFIKRFEGYHKDLGDGRVQAYPDPGSGGDPWTIGYGSTGPDIRRGTIWTKEQADKRFAEHVAEFAAGVRKMIGNAPTTDNQFSAMTSLAYNIGLGAFQKSSVLRKHRAGDYEGAARSFLLWNKAGGRVMRGLTRRRLAEADLYDD